MLRIRALALIFCCLASPFAFGLGLGPLKSTSALNEPFEGRIEIIGAKAGDFDTLTIGIAGQEHFERAGIERPSVLLQLRFTIDDSAADTNFISVASKDPIREPFLNFLLELNWSNGRLLREYTVLLDPPLYDPNRRRAAPAPAPSASAEEPAPAAPAEAPPESDEAPAPTASISGEYLTGSEIGPMVATDTLWSIASNYRPDESITVQQMMLALLRDNPAAFGEANVNRLLRGAILQLPDEASMRSVTAAEAFAEVKRQHQLWEAYRQEIGTAPTAQPLGAPAAALSEAASTESEGTDARLELVAPEGTDGGAAPGTADTDQGSELLREELDATSQANLELDEKLTEAEEIIDLLQRQVNIQDEDLAALQARLAELGVEHGDLGAVDEPTESEPETVATVEPEIGIETATEPEVDADAEPEAEMAAAPADAVEEDVAQEDAEIGAEADVADEQTVVDSEAAEGIIEEEPGPSAAPGFPANLIPESLASKVPGGALTVLGIAALVILGLFVGVVQFLLKSRSGRDEAEVVAVSASAMDDDIEETEDPMITAATAVDEDDASEAITSVDDVDDAAADFDPDATVEAEAEVEDDSTVVTAAEAAVSAPEESEEDPLEEVNVYLAYERFDQAQELVERVIADHPDRHEYKLRLLEVYYSSNDKSAYEEAARSLHEGVGEADPLWESAVAMWSEMSPERALFEEGAEAAAPAPDTDAAKAFVDITGEDEDQSATGDQTVAHAPGGADDGGLDFDLAAGKDNEADEGILDLTASAGADDMLDLTVTDTDEEGGDEEILDITDAGAPEADVITDDDVLDLTGGADADIEASGGDASDLLDVTKTGDLTSVEDNDLLNVTATRLSADEEVDDATADAGEDAGLEITDITAADDSGEAADAGLDFDISDSVAPAFEINTDEEGGDILDLSDTGDMEDIASEAVSAEDDLLEFDIGGLDTDIEVTGAEDDAAPSGPDGDEMPTVDLESALESVQEGGGAEEDGDLDFDITMDAESDAGELGISATADASEDVSGDSDLDFDITMGEENLSDGLDITGADDGEGESLEITMGTPEETPADGEMSLQGSELDEIALDAGGDLNAEDEDFDFSLEGTAEMDGIAADDTLDMASVGSENEGELEIDEDASLDDLAMDLDAAIDDPSGGELDLEIEAVVEDAGDGHLKTVALDADARADLDDDGEKTVVMPMSDDVERQSDTDEADTKLNLAKAYIELGDTEGARSILDEVASDGNDEQKAEAKTLLDQISG